MDPCETIKIDKISIDLVSSNEKNAASKCEHFSIRGFVSEARKKDWKICWPFTSDADGIYLPPLHVPKYKFWGCENCLHELDVKSCKSENRDAIRILSYYQQAAKPAASESRGMAATDGRSQGKEGGDVAANRHPEVAEVQEKIMASEEDAGPRGERLLDAGEEQSSKRNETGEASNENSGGLSHRKRARKVKLLTELLCANGGQGNKTSEKVLSVKRGLSHCKKRKSPQDEEWKPAGASSSNRVKKNSKLAKKDEKSADAATPTEDLELAFAKMCIQLGKVEAPLITKRKQKSSIVESEIPLSESKNDGDQSELNAGNDAVFKTREMDLFPLSAPRFDLEKSVEEDDQQAWKTLRSHENDKAASLTNKCGPASHHLSAGDASLDKALNLSLNSYISPPCFDFNKAGENSSDPVFKNNDPRCGVRAPPSGYRIPFVSEKQNKGMCSSLPSSGVPFNGVSNVLGMRSEQGVGEFPIEIVELMAKNQYERRRFEVPPVIDFSVANPHQEMNLLHSDAVQMRKRMGKIGDFADYKIPNSIDFFPPKAVNVTQSHTNLGFKPFLDHREKSTTGFQRCFPCDACHQKKDPWPQYMYGFHHGGAGPSSTYLSRFPEFPRKGNHVADPLRRPSEASKKSSVSLDLYSNDTIPAMHLLSLMDAGVGSSRQDASSSPYRPDRMAKRQVTEKKHEFPRRQPSRYLFASSDLDKQTHKLTPPVCTTNRNPADFSIPDELNIYMIPGETLKFDDPVSISKPKRRRPKIVQPRSPTSYIYLK